LVLWLLASVFWLPFWWNSEQSGGVELCYIPEILMYLGVARFVFSSVIWKYSMFPLYEYFVAATLELQIWCLYLIVFQSLCVLNSDFRVVSTVRGLKFVPSTIQLLLWNLVGSDCISAVWGIGSVGLRFLLSYWQGTFVDGASETCLIFLHLGKFLWWFWFC